MIHKICENILESLVKNLLLKKIFWKAFFEEVKFENGGKAWTWTP